MEIRPETAGSRADRRRSRWKAVKFPDTLHDLPAISDLPTVRNDFQKSYRGSEVLRANAERNYHDELNASGATVRNLNGTVFVVYGDGRLHDLNPDAMAQISGAVQASLQSLFDAHVRMSRQNVTADEIGKAGSDYFAALRFVPVYIESDSNSYFTGMWTRYAMAVKTLTGSTQPMEKWNECQIPYLSGADWTWPAKRSSLCATGPQASR